MTTVRLFVALDPPGDVVETLVTWRAPLLRERKDLRAVPSEGLHVTLCFLGAMSEEAVAPLSALVEACAADAGGVAGLALDEPLWLPRRRPRVLAVAVDDRRGQLTALQRQLVQRLATDGWHAPERRRYLPHVTVARVRGREATPRAGEAPAPPAVAFDGAALVLYRSHLIRMARTTSRCPSTDSPENGRDPRVVASHPEAYHRCMGANGCSTPFRPTAGVPSCPHVSRRSHP